MSKSKGIIESLFEKPWEKDQIEIDNKHQGQTLNLSKYKVGLRTIMVVSTVIFSLFIVAYSDRMLVHDWRSMPEPLFLWLNNQKLANSYFGKLSLIKTFLVYLLISSIGVLSMGIIFVSALIFAHG